MGVAHVLVCILFVTSKSGGRFLTNVQENGPKKETKLMERKENRTELTEWT